MLSTWRNNTHFSVKHKYSGQILKQIYTISHGKSTAFTPNGPGFSFQLWILIGRYVSKLLSFSKVYWHRKKKGKIIPLGSYKDQIRWCVYNTWCLRLGKTLNEQALSLESLSRSRHWEQCYTHTIIQAVPMHAPSESIIVSAQSSCICIPSFPFISSCL